MSFFFTEDARKNTHIPLEPLQQPSVGHVDGQFARVPGLFVRLDSVHLPVHDIFELLQAVVVRLQA